MRITVETNEEVGVFLTENPFITEQNYKVVYQNELPKINPIFHIAYNIVEDILVPDITIGKEVIKKHIRYRREKLFAPLDTQYMLALEDGDIEKQKEIVAKKKNLRNLTNHPLIENAQTLEELSKINIDDLFK